MAKRKTKRATSRRAVAACVAAIVERVEQAASTAKAAATLMKKGDDERAFQVTLEMEQDLHEANYLLQAASILRRGRSKPA